MTWPPDYVRLFRWRQKQLAEFRSKPWIIDGAKEYYRTRPVEFICDWMDTYDPRNSGKPGKITRMPFILFPRQKELVQFIVGCLEADADGLIEKCRDAGVTWVSCGISVWLWLFWPGMSIGWGSRKQELVDRLGDMDSIFEKLRSIIRLLPREFLPRGFSEKDDMTFMRILNRENGASITGEIGDNIGRGGRKRIYFKDESAHYGHPELIDAALGDNTRVQMDISSVTNPGSVFHRKREAGIEWQPGAEIVKGRTNVFIFDWSHHPEKTPEWYETRRKKHELEGTLHIFAQEVERNYFSAMQNVIIRPEWFQAALDAHKKLGIEESGGWVAGLDVADGGADKSALAQRHGIVLKYADHWAENDTGQTARRAIKSLLFNDGLICYDSIGVGAGCKSEFNRLRSSDVASDLIIGNKIKIEPWNAGGSVLFPNKNIIKNDKDSPKNNDYFANLKAQAWWMLARRFHLTYRVMTEGIEFDPENIVSIDTSSIPKQTVIQMQKELCQAQSSLSTGRLKYMVDKAPDGTSSPNIADAIVMAYWPVKTSTYTLDHIS